MSTPSVPTPRDGAPASERRKALVTDVMESLAGVDSLPTDERLAQLDEAQRVLASVLQDSGANQLGLPGVNARP